MDAENRFYITTEGLKKIEQEYKNLTELRMAKTKGDVPKIWHSEDLDPEYLSFQEDLNFIETRILELENILKNAKMIEPPPQEQRSLVGLGSTVVVEIDKEHQDEFMIVGTIEANPSLGKISNASPVGKALLGHKVGDEIIMSSPIKTVYKIKKIKYKKA